MASLRHFHIEVYIIYIYHVRKDMHYTAEEKRKLREMIEPDVFSDRVVLFLKFFDEYGGV